MRDFILNWKCCSCKYSNIVRTMIADSVVDSQLFYLDEWFFSHQENHPSSQEWNWEANLFRKQEIRVFDDGRLVQYSLVLQVHSSINNMYTLKNILSLVVVILNFFNNERPNGLRAQSAKFSLFVSKIDFEWIFPFEVSQFPFGWHTVRHTAATAVWAMRAKLLLMMKNDLTNTNCLPMK